MRSNTRLRALSMFLAGLLAAGAVAEAMPRDHLTTTDYAEIGAWTLRVAKAPNGETEICDAYVTTGSERALRIAFDAGSMVVAFNGPGSVASEAPMKVEVWFDDARAESKTYEMSVTADATDYTWRGLTETTDEPSSLLDMLSNLSSIHFAYDVPGVGRHVETFELANSNQVVKKTLACIQGGRADAGGPSVAAKPAPIEAGAAGPGGREAVIEGSCRLKVDGRTYVDLRDTCRIWLANDGTGRFWINTDRAGYLGDHFAEISPAGDGTASGNWNGAKGGTHAQDFLGEDFHKAAGGCWINRRAEICAMR